MKVYFDRAVKAEGNFFQFSLMTETEEDIELLPEELARVFGATDDEGNVWVKNIPIAFLL